MHRESRVLLAGYNDQSKGEVVRELDVGARLFARVVDRLSTEQQKRRCIYDFPEPTDRDVAWVVRNTVHEAVHHGKDLRTVRERVAGRRDPH